jgi:preprotein translocase subunit SecG
MQQLLVIFHIIIALSLVMLVLLQRGKGADAGATFGSGAANTMFGSQGSTPFLIKLTALLAALFFATSLGLGYLISQQSKIDVVDLAAQQMKQSKGPVE